MAKKSGIQPASWEPKVNAYVQDQMDKDAITQFEAWLEELGPADMAGFIGVLEEDELELKILQRQGGYVAVLHDHAREDAGQPFLLTGWSRVPEKAFCLVFWKHTIRAERDWAKLLMEAKPAPEYR